MFKRVKETKKNAPQPDLAEANDMEDAGVADGVGAEEQPSADAEPAEEAAPSTDELAADLPRQVEKSRDDYLRLAAEFDNYRRRTAREFAAVVRNATEDLIVELLDVLDNFERAFKSREENPDLEAYDKGIKLLYGKLVEILSREGLQRLESVGQTFDPRFHEAVAQVESEEQEPDTVAIEVQAGYSLNDKVIRHAKVGVVKSNES
jgi:molecular chaperone GrpE